MEAFFAGAREHRERWDALRREVERRASEDPALSITDLPGYRPLAELARGLRETGRAIGGDGTYRPHLDLVPGGRRTLESAMERLGQHDLPDRFVETMDRIAEAKRDARERGVLPFQDGGYLGAIAGAERLAGERGLEEAARRRLQAEIEDCAAQLEQWLGIVQLLGDMARLEVEDCDLDERAARRDVPRSQLPGWRDWLDRNGKLVEDVRTALDDESVRDVLGVRPDVAEHLRRGLESAGERRRAAEGNEERLGGDVVPLAAAAVDDYPIRCKRDVAEHDLLRWGALVEADAPAEGSGLDAGAQRFVRFEGVLVGRTPGRTEKEDRCTVDVRWRSDGGPMRRDGGPARRADGGRLLARLHRRRAGAQGTGGEGAVEAGPRTQDAAGAVAGGGAEAASLHEHEDEPVTGG